MYNELRRFTMNFFFSDIDQNQILEEIRSEKLKPDFPTINRKTLFDYDKLRAEFHKAPAGR